MTPAIEAKYTCKLATIQQLDMNLEEICYDYDLSLKKFIHFLKEFLHPVTTRELDWRNVHHFTKN